MQKKISTQQVHSHVRQSSIYVPSTGLHGVVSKRHYKLNRPRVAHTQELAPGMGR